MNKGPVTEIESRDDVLLVVVLSRTLDDTATNELVDNILVAAAEHPGPPIVLDMKNVRFAPSVALGSLVRLSKSFKLDGRRLILIGVDQVLDIFNSLEDALNAPPRGQ
jgi:anti-anti-sigma factor